ncbi:MAG TPA: VapC toxin family PIN domain ribonuclease [Candidatus Limnocylindrales bacterium]|nr:VapC toxin family PIN domain ribonuclease [Candidatus Limnocylindrales bacterium]
MALVIDAGALYAQADEADPGHAAVRAVLTAEREELVTTELAVAEADYLILDRLGPDVEAAFLADLAEGTFEVECLGRDGIEAASRITRRYRDLRLGLADASLVVLAARRSTRRILTFDERAFRTVQPLQGGAFELLPAER